MDEKKNANQAPELKDEELDQVAGGVHDQEENRRYDLGAITCPHCGASFRNEKDRDDHVQEKHPDQV